MATRRLYRPTGGTRKLGITAKRFYLAALLLPQSLWSQTTLTQSDDLAIDVSASNDEIVIAALGGLWTLGGSGGVATPLLDPAMGAGRPRWSPDGEHVLFVARTGGATSVQIIERRTRQTRELVAPEIGAREPAWHPSGERIIFSAPEGATGLDLFELDLQSGLRWAISAREGNETAPAWSQNGRHLAYVWSDGETWSLMLRRFGQADVELFRSTTPLGATAWRPDGTLISFVRATDAGAVQQMAIVSTPPLVRDLVVDENLSRGAVRWADRSRYYYVADGSIRAREFGAWRSSLVPFRAQVTSPSARKPIMIVNRSLSAQELAAGRLVVRAGRVFDGLSASYRSNIDILVEDGIVKELALRRDWDETPIVDLPATTVMPGYIDAFSALPRGDSARGGAELLSWGVTTLVSTHFSDALSEAWNSAATPGPRLLPVRRVDADPAPDDTDNPFLVSAIGHGAEDANKLVEVWRSRGRPVIADGWIASRQLGTNAFLGTETVPRSFPAAGSTRVVDAAALILISGLADASTPGLRSLFRARQADGLDPASANVRQLERVPMLSGRSAALVIGSAPSGLPAGLALHAELNALVAAGVAPERVFAAAGVNAARLLGLSGQIGEISPGARADFVLVLGDPLQSVSASKDIVGVVRGGHFFSLSSLLERRHRTVE